jgi:hypothetical protein
MTKIYQPDYAYTLNFREDQLEQIKQSYSARFDYAPRPKEDKLFGHISQHLADIVIACAPVLRDHLYIDGSMVFIVPPSTSSSIHIDHRWNKPILRNVCINFPISITPSVTSFYTEPDAKFGFIGDAKYTTGIYYTAPKPIFSYEMEQQAVLINTAKYHSVTNFSSTDTRIVLSIPVKIGYTFSQALEILKSLGYAD